MTHNPVLLLSGTPASGKDTVTAALQDLSDRFIHFRKHKTATGGRLDDSYVLVDESTFEGMAADGEFIQHHYRYERGYGVSWARLEAHWDRDEIPVIHVGNYRNIDAFLDTDAVAPTSVLLLTSLAETKRRLAGRSPNDPAEIDRRLTAYAEERRQLSELIDDGCQMNFDLMLDNTALSPRSVARTIGSLLAG